MSLSGRLARAVAVDRVVATAWVHVRRERQRFARFAVAAELHQAASEAEQGVVVRGRAVDDGLELHARLFVVAGAVAGPAERLADRGLLGVQVAGLLERDH